MGLFSERYGYTKPSDVIIREKITPEIQNAILSCYDRFRENVQDESIYNWVYSHMENYLWTQFLNERKASFNWKKPVICEYLNNTSNAWYKKLDIVEFSIKYLYMHIEKSENQYLYNAVEALINRLNYEFKRLNFAYRIINKEIAEITSKEEIVAIEEALNSSKNNIRIHLNKALELYAQKPTGDHRNSIKESISAVEAFCREKTGEDTLGKALNKLESNSIIMPKLLKIAFDKLYAYTNQPDTGIRHALMDDEGPYVPQAEEALFMLVSCSAFINYLNKKVK